jgi:hypothetical protein
MPMPCLRAIVEIAGYLADDLRFPDSAGTPNVQGHTFAKEVARQN